jgi:hypothetical protein
MGWFSRLRGDREVERVNPWDETPNTGAPYDALNAMRSRPENAAAPGDRSEVRAEEIRLRQISLVVRYVAAVRAR